MANQRALITGASSGIGLELARLFAADDIDLVLTARRVDRLQALAGELAGAGRGQVTVLPADLGQPGAARALTQELAARRLPIDWLINNAGVGLYGAFTQTAWQEELALMQLNIVSLVELTKWCVPGMVERRFGRILNLASTAAFQPGPLMAVYYASKAFVLSFSEALAEELTGTGVSITALCPGPTRSEFQATAKLVRSRLFARGVMQADVVARAGYEGLKAQRRVVVPGWRNRVLAQSVRFLPRRLVTRLVRAAQAHGPSSERQAER